MPNENIARIEAEMSGEPIAAPPEVDESTEDVVSTQPVEGQSDDPPSGAQAATDAETGAVDTQDEPAASTAEHAKRNRDVHKRINELTREKYDALRAAKEAERQAAYWRAQIAVSQPQNGAEPTLESTGFDVEEYARQKAEWLVHQAEQQTRQTQQAAWERRILDSYNERAAAFAEHVPDYEEALQQSIGDVPPMMARAIMESENGPQVAYHLAKHKAEFDRIRALMPMQIVRELTKLELKLAADDKQDEPPQRAPAKVFAPPPTVQTKAPAARDIAAMTVEDHLAELERKRQRRWHR